MRIRLSAASLILVMALAPPVFADPPATAPTLRQRVVSGVRQLSLRTANGYRNLRERIPPVLRHGAMTLLSSGVTCASLEGLASRGDIASPMGLLSLTGVVLGVSATLHQSTRTMRAAFPGQMKRAGERLRRTPLFEPWLKDTRPWLQRLQSRFRRGAADRR